MNLGELAFIAFLVIIGWAWFKVAYLRETGEWPKPDRSWLLPGDDDEEGED